MARIRSIKPEFWEDEKIATLPLPCRLFFIGTWNHADDNGVIRGNASILKSKIFPYDDSLRVGEVSKWIDALVNARMLVPISHKDESYYVIRTFHSHQKFDARYPNYLIPKEEFELLYPHSESTPGTQRAHSEATAWEGEGEEGIGNKPPIIPPPGDKDEFSFDDFWELYDKKVGDKERLRRKWDKLSRSDKQKIFEHIPLYKLSKPEKQYRKNPSTFLNQKSWNDELIYREEQQKQTNKFGMAI